MTLDEFQPFVEAAVAEVERVIAQRRYQQALEDESASIKQAIEWVYDTKICTHCGEQNCHHILMMREQLEPMTERLKQIEIEMGKAITPDRIPQLALRSVPMDMITSAVVCRIYKLPAGFPVKSIKNIPSQDLILEAVHALAARWRTSAGELPTTEITRVVRSE